MTNHESFGGGCVLWLGGLLLAMLGLAWLAGRNDLPGTVLGWIF